MNDPSRIEALTVSQTVPRQTPKTDFGEVVSHAIGTVVSGGASLVQGALGALPVLSAAASGVQTVGALTRMGGATSTAPLSTLSTLSSISTIGTSTSPLATPVSASAPTTVQGILQSLSGGGELSNGEYLALQQSIQQENTQYTALSNILKVRSDSAKNAINNFR